MSATAARVSQLRALESEAVFVMREVVAELARPVLLFSGGKDSIALLRVAEKAFRPLPLPFPVLHVDTGHNFPEVIEFRDRRLLEGGHRLIVASVQASIDRGRVKEDTPGGSRNRLQTVTLLDGSRNTGSMLRSVEPGATRSGRVPRSACSPSVTSSGNGSRVRSASSHGRSTTRGFGAVSQRIRSSPLSL
jgi:Phosphoadenosine phosphosulfate reductase family